MKVLQSQSLTVKAGQQADFFFKPVISRRYVIATHGESDTLLTLFEKPQTGDPVFLAGDDDSGDDRNARIQARLIARRTYIIRIRLFFAQREGETAIMIE